MVLLLLQDLDLVATLLDERSDVKDLVLPLLLVVGWVGNAKLLALSPVVDRHVTELGPAVLETDTVESDAAHLHPEVGLLDRSLGEVLEHKLLDKVLLGDLAHHLRV